VQHVQAVQNVEGHECSGVVKCGAVRLTNGLQKELGNCTAEAPEDAELTKTSLGIFSLGSLAPVRRLVLVLEAADPPAHTSWGRIMSNSQISSVDVMFELILRFGIRGRAV